MAINPMLPIYVQCFVIAILGQLLHLLLKANSLRKKAKAGNAEFTLKGFFKDDALSVLAAFVFILICLFFISDVLHLKPNILYYLKFCFVFIGYAGSDFASRLFGVATKKINEVIDRKTNIADGIK